MIEQTGSNPLLNKDVVIIQKTGMKILGRLIAFDANFATIDFKGERQLIPMETVSKIVEAR